MRWQTFGERTVYDSPWVRLDLVDVEIPGHGRVDHHVLRFPRPAVGVVVHDPDRGVLLLHRHRFITDSWGWEVPAGGVDPGEEPAEAAVRECREETGWAPGPLTAMGAYYPSNGISDQQFMLWRADGARHEGDPTDPAESSRVEWVPLDEARELVLAGQVTDGMSLTALLRFLLDP